jgi:hypothetical protein
MDNGDVVKMHKAGLAEETILAAIQKDTANFDTSADALIALKGAGLSEKVIQKMIAPQATVSASPEAARAPAFSASYAQEFPSISPAKIVPAVGGEYFTRFTFREEGDEHSTTNYARGNVVPINTPVKLVSMAGTKLVLKILKTGQVVKVKNEEDYTKKTIAEMAALMLASEKTLLEKLPADVALSVQNGELRKGMTRELVLMARGYPPAHVTASLESDRWVYWSSRFVKLTIVFSNGRLSEGRGLY